MITNGHDDDQISTLLDPNLAKETEEPQFVVYQRCEHDRAEPRPGADAVGSSNVQDNPQAKQTVTDPIDPLHCLDFRKTQAGTAGIPGVKVLAVDQGGTITSMKQTATIKVNLGPGFESQSGSRRKFIPDEGYYTRCVCVRACGCTCARVRARVRGCVSACSPKSRS